MDGIIENAQKVIKMSSADVYAWVKSIYPEGVDIDEAEVVKFWERYSKQVKQLAAERASIIKKIG
jgi:hypothetical protein